MEVKQKIVVIGAGGLARETKYLIDDINRSHPTYEFIGYLVSDLNHLTERDSTEEVIGDLSWFDAHPEPINAVIGIGTPKYRIDVANAITARAKHVAFPVLIHPNVIYDRKSCKFGQGVVICASNVLTVNIQIKEFAWLNLACTVGHETIIGRGSVLNPTTNISGGVKIGDGVLVGTGVQILQYIEINDSAVVGAGSVVTKNVLAGITVVGSPAKPLVKPVLG